MQHFDNLFQFVVPLTFLAIWVLTSLFNREAQPLPPRMGRPQPPGGLPGGLGSATVSRAEALKGDPAQRWAVPAASDRPGIRRPAGRLDDDILIIEEPRGRAPGVSPTARAGGNSGGSRRVGRSRPMPGGTPRRPEPASPRPLSGTLGAPVPLDQPMSRTIELNPLAMPHSPLLASDPRSLARTIAEPTHQAGRPAQVWDAFRVQLTTPSQLRDAIVLNEILQPPLSLRRRNPGHPA
jgi:hypothetical protein